MTSYAAARLGVFAAALLVCAAAESAAPRRARVAERGPRWLVNLSLMLLGNLAARLAAPLAAVEAAARAEAAGWGLLNWAAAPPLLKTALSVLILDLVIYWQHRVFHRWPLLWRLHAVHHTDLDLDASSSVRFHPLEIALSLLIKIAAVSALGASPLGVALLEIILSTAAVFHHSNIALPGRVDAALRLLTVTPDMHRVHHSPDRDETDSNFSFNLTCWDRLFGTYRAQPRRAHESMPLGLPGERDPRALGLLSSLARPFRTAA